MMPTRRSQGTMSTSMQAKKKMRWNKTNNVDDDDGHEMPQIPTTMKAELRSKTDW